MSKINDNQSEPRYRIGELIFDPNNRSFERDGNVTTLPKLSFKLLLALVRHAPDTVDFDHLYEEVWGQSVVSPETLTQRVKLLRDAIGDDHLNPEYVETRRGHGYRLIPTVEPLDRMAPEPIKRNRLVFPSIGLAVIVLGLLISLIAGRMEESHETPQTIAVLPFVNVGADPEQEYFSDGLADELLNLLTKVPGLQVAARTSSFSFRGGKTDIPTIAEQLRVSHVLEGSVRKDGNDIRVSLQLVKADDGYNLWSATYDRTLDDVFTLQSEIAASVVEALQITLFGKPPSVQQTSSEVYNLYLKARYFDNLKGKENWEKAVSNYQQALSIDPDFAPAWAGLSITYRYQANVHMRDFDEGMALAREAVQNALALDEDLAIAWSNLGQIELLDTWDWTAANKAIHKALQLAPSNAEVLNHAAGLAVATGRLDDAISFLKGSVALDPLNQSSHNSLGLAFMNSGRLDEAEAVFRQLLELNPKYPWGHINLGRVKLLKAQPEEALVKFARSSNVPWRDSGIALALSDLGRHDEARAALMRLENEYANGFSFQIAAIHAWRGDLDLAFDWLQRSYQSHEVGMLYVPTDPFFSNIHDDPRWLDLLDKLELPYLKPQF